MRRQLATLILVFAAVLPGACPTVQAQVAESAWALPRDIIHPEPAPAPLVASALACDTWVGLRGFEWYNDIWDICSVPGTDGLWAVGASYYGPDGPVTSNANPVVCRSTDGGYTWALDQPEFSSDSIPNANVILYQVEFVNALVGFAAGGAVRGESASSTSAVVYRTTNGGVSWTLVYEGRIGPFYPRHVIGNIVFADELNGWAVGPIDQYDNVAIIHTSDGGDTWVHQTSGVNAAVTQVDFVDASTGFAIANLGAVLTTVDGGAQWTIAADENSFYNGAIAMEFVSAATGVAANIGGLALRTTDGGVTWTSYYSGERLWELDFVDSNVGWGVGEDGTIVKTSDGGVNWQHMTSPPNITPLHGCVARDANNVWMSGEGTIGYTPDNGATWRHVDAVGYITSATLYDLEFTDSQNGWGVGNRGEMVRTTDGGSTWHHSFGVSININAIDFASPTHGWVAGGNAVWHTNNGGASWQPKSTVAPSLIDIHFRNEKLGWLTATQGAIYRTTDGGATWDPLPSGTTEGLYAIDFVSDTVGWVVGWNSTILHTIDGGDSWQTQTLPDTVPLYSVRFVDALTGWIAAGRAIYATTDGGNTWQTQHTQTINHLSTIDFVDALNGVAVGGRTDVAQILLTNDGGATWTECGDNMDGHSMRLGQKLFGVVMPEPGLAYAAGSKGWVVRIGPRPSGIDDTPLPFSKGLEVFPARPNPFNDATRIVFRLAAQSDVTIEIFDVAGRRVFVDYQDALPAGDHAYRYTGRSRHGARLPSGIYFQRLTALGLERTSKLVIIR